MGATAIEQTTSAARPLSAVSLTVSIVLEWENAMLSDAHRSRRLLDALCEQITELREQVEVLIIHDPAEVAAAELSAFIETHLGVASTRPNCVHWRLESANDLHYYDLKNEGARRVAGDILVFVDSDVIPQAGWLSGLIQPFREEPELQVVTGNTWIDPEGLVGKAFAAGWFYGLPASLSHPRTLPGWIWANNVAYRRKRFLAAPYPKMPDGNTRDACSRQFRAYQQAGVPMTLQMSAEVSHPAPNGMRHFVLRGLAEGRDHFFATREEKSSPRAFASLTRRAFSRINQAVRRCTSPKVRLHMRLPAWQILPCLAVVAAYYGLYLLGAGIAMIWPQSVMTAWRI